MCVCVTPHPQLLMTKRGCERHAPRIQSTSSRSRSSQFITSLPSLALSRSLGPRVQRSSAAVPSPGHSAASPSVPVASVRRREREIGALVASSCHSPSLTRSHAHNRSCALFDCIDSATHARRRRVRAHSQPLALSCLSSAPDAVMGGGRIASLNSTTA